VVVVVEPDGSPRRVAFGTTGADDARMTPEDVRVEASCGFLASALRGRVRVLEVGCGRGTVARRLGAMGFTVTALDRELRDPTPAPGVTFVERDLLDYTAEPFDAIAFTASLHHIAPLDRAVTKAAELLATGGMLAVDDFAIEVPDATTLRWYYDTQELLVAAGLYPRDRLDAANHDLVARWHHAHAEHMIHTGQQMRSAIAERFAIRDVLCVEYLHHYIGGGLSADDSGGAIAAHIFASEQRGIVDGVLMPVGLRVVAIK
jgi:SAM-dependent methyltransferase